MVPDETESSSSTSTAHPPPPPSQTGGSGWGRVKGLFAPRHHHRKGESLAMSEVLPPVDQEPETEEEEDEI